MGAVRVVVNPAAATELMHLTLPVIEEKVAAIAEACNADSSWGGYDSAAEVTAIGAMGVVWSIGDHDDEHRRNRLVMNLGAGG